MASQGTDEPILDIWRKSAPDIRAISTPSPRAGGRSRSYTDILSPSRQGLTTSLLTPREITNDTWLKVLHRICWKSGRKLR